LSRVCVCAVLQWVSVEIAPLSRSVTPTAGRANKPNQFAPIGINPAELKEKVKSVCQTSNYSRCSSVLCAIYLSWRPPVQCLLGFWHKSGILPEMTIYCSIVPALK